MSAVKSSPKFSPTEALALFAKADAAGMAAASAHKPEPMVVRSGSYVYEPVMDGVCGFAWVNVKPGNSQFAKWMVKEGKARKDSYEGGVQVWVSQFNQSMEKKYAYAAAFANVLNEAGVNAYAGQRMD